MGIKLVRLLVGVTLVLLVALVTVFLVGNIAGTKSVSDPRLSNFTIHRAFRIPAYPISPVGRTSTRK